MILVKEQKHTLQQIRTGSPERDPNKYSQLIFETGVAIQWKNNSLFHKWHWNNWMSTCKKKINQDTDLTPFTKINSSRIDLNVKCKTFNF